MTVYSGLVGHVYTSYINLAFPNLSTSLQKKKKVVRSWTKKPCLLQVDRNQTGTGLALAPLNYFIYICQSGPVLSQSILTNMLHNGHDGTPVASQK